MCPIRRGVAVHKHHDARQIENIKSERGRYPWCRQGHVAYIVGEKFFSDGAEKKEVERKQNDQRAGIDDSEAFHPASAVGAQQRSCQGVVPTVMASPRSEARATVKLGWKPASR